MRLLSRKKWLKYAKSLLFSEGPKTYDFFFTFSGKIQFKLVSLGEFKWVLVNVGEFWWVSKSFQAKLSVNFELWGFFKSKKGLTFLKSLPMFKIRPTLKKNVCFIFFKKKIFWFLFFRIKPTFKKKAYLKKKSLKKTC